MKRIWIFLFLLALLLLIISNIRFSHKTTGTSFMVVTENSLASQVGADILRAGGNAIDAAVAVGYALAVVNPCCGNIGGGGFMTIHFANGKNTFLNFREKAPLKANKDMFLDASGNRIPNITTSGFLAVAVPGTVLGLDTALQKYGTMTRQQVMLPAIKLAKFGFSITPYEEKLFSKYADYFRQHPETALFLNLHSGDKLVQNDLANTLIEIAKQGSQFFYHGYIAQEIVNASQRNGGVLTMEDFANYTIQELTPITCHYRGYTLISAPPPSSGGVILCEMLNILENFPLNQLGFRSPKSSYYLLETMRYGFTDRNTKLGDPDFVKNPVEELISTDYAKKISTKILSAEETPIPNNIEEEEHINTTHYSIIDSKGNAVAVTYTLNGFFGAKVIAGRTGFFLNNEMDDFVAQLGVANKFGLIEHHANAIQPGKRPLSSMAPTIILKDGRIFMVIGSPGGPRIITSILHTILNVIDYGMTIDDAINMPRFHYQVHPNVVDLEPNAFTFKTEKILGNMGYQMRYRRPWSAVEALLIDPENGKIEGASDERRPDGAAIGE